MSNEMITAALPTFQRSKLLRQAVASVLAQTWPHLRVLVCDNASADDTRIVVSELAAIDSRVRYHRHTVNLGGIKNYSYAVGSVQTPFFSLFADDDVLMPDFYEKAMTAFRAHADAMFVAMPTLEVDDSGTVLGGTGAGLPYERRYYLAGEAFHRVPWIWTGWVFRREVIEEIGFTVEAAGPACDVGFLRHVTARFPGVVLPDVAALVRAHPGAASSDPTAFLEKANRDMWNALSAPIEQDPKVPESIRSSIRPYIEQMYVRSLRRAVLSSLIDGDASFALKIISTLRGLGYGWSAALLRTAVASCAMTFVSTPLRAYGKRRRTAQREQRLEIARRFEPQRDYFRQLLTGTRVEPKERAG